MERLEALLDVVVPGYVAEGKSYLTVAVGCTGGRHRSVVVAEELGALLPERGMPVTVDHRDLDAVSADGRRGTAGRGPRR